MPTNLYGTNDNFDLTSSHVLPALIRKFHDARERGDAEVVVWGSGAVRGASSCTSTIWRTPACS